MSELAKKLLREHSINAYEQLVAVKGSFEAIKDGRENFSTAEKSLYDALTAAQKAIEQMYIDCK
jgi:hypothetical protein